MISTGMKLVLLGALLLAAFWLYELRSTDIDTIVRAVNDPAVLVERARERRREEGESPVDTVVVLFRDPGELAHESFDLPERPSPVFSPREEPAPPTRAPEPAPRVVTVVEHVVKDGENLSKIAARYFGTGIHWRQLLDYNDIPDPDNVSPGMVVTIRIESDGSSAPPPIASAPEAEQPPAVVTPSETTHTVRRNETLADLARRYYRDRSRWKEIHDANIDVLPDPNVLRIGMKLKIP